MKYLYILLTLMTFSINATTWGASEVEDPINSDAKCKVNEPVSSGSYIYQWPSKYDQVFWPLTSPEGIWYCESSGFIAFIGDFDDITEEEKTKISDYLAAKEKKHPDSLIQKLELLEVLYSFRSKDDEFNNRIIRVFAYLYEQEGKLELANNYRKIALSQINEALKTELPEYKKLEYLFVAANYERQLGNVSSSERRLSELKQSIKSMKDENLEDFGSYLMDLSKDTLRIDTGGVLAPSTEDKGA
ncbi:hypothetical protein [Rheinheimera hassiensis]|uniref:hypothetical protein n=1 Tax=Rheinheimera hassiensis TaxID=1193627 RepID=UPI001F05D19D|nr:hypothetical protein [Rheinheimera hassiensis]